MSRPRLRFAIDSEVPGLGMVAARDALYAWLLARRGGGVIVLRNDLAAPERGEIERQFVDDLLWLGLGWDEGLEAQGDRGPYRCSQRGDQYRAAAQELLRRGVAYRCSCGFHPRGVPAPSRQACSCRGTARPGDETILNGLNLPILLRVDGPDGMEDFILLHEAGEPESDFTSSVDDISMGITHVVSSAGDSGAAARRSLIHAAIGGHDSPVSIELPPIDMAAGDSTGVRPVDLTIGWFRSLGYPPEAVLNMLAHLGAMTDVRQALLTREEMLSGFDPDLRIAGTRAFDFELLDGLSRRHLARLPRERLAALAADHLARAGLLNQPPSAAEALWAGAVARLYVERIARMSDLPQRSEILFHFNPEQALADDSIRRVLFDPPSRRLIEIVKEAWMARSNGDEPAGPGFQALATAVRRLTGAKGKTLYEILRIALTGGSEGPDLTQLVALIEEGRRLPLPIRVIGCVERANGILALTAGGSR